MKPIVIFDGECGFCRGWIETWRQSTGERVDFVAFQDVTDPFRGISREEFRRTIHLFQSHGVATGADAVFSLLAYTTTKRHWKWLYDHVFGFAWISEVVYQWIAARRPFASRVMAWFRHS